MKRLLLLPILILIPLLSNAQEKYFHDLKGMEDSEGVTQLFYRIYEINTYTCHNSEGGYDFNIYPSSNDVYHFNTQTLSDSIKFGDYYQTWCINMHYSQATGTYAFYDNDLNEWLATSFWECGFGIGNKDNEYLNLSGPCVIKIKTYTNNYDNYIASFFLSPNSDSLYVKWYDGVTIPLSSSPETWPSSDGSYEDYEQFISFVDSVKIPYNLISIHPVKDSLYYAIDSTGKLYLSEYYSSSFTMADSSSQFSELFFDSDNAHIYSLDRDNNLLVSNNLGRKDSWTIQNLPSETRFIENDRDVSGNILSTDTTHIYVSHDYGATFELFLETEHKITGLYKKPNSETLYVLTTDELLVVENGIAKSLKTLPVSNESEPTSLPNEITLFQNYPNPFNPSTVISFQLPVSSSVKLAVFDMLGRKIATLVDGKSPAGLQEVTFNAQGLSSGMYFYRLEANGSTLTKRLTIIK